MGDRPERQSNEQREGVSQFGSFSLPCPLIRSLRSHFFPSDYIPTFLSSVTPGAPVQQAVHESGKLVRFHRESSSTFVFYDPQAVHMIVHLFVVIPISPHIFPYHCFTRVRCVDVDYFDTLRPVLLFPVKKAAPVNHYRDAMTMCDTYGNTLWMQADEMFHFTMKRSPAQYITENITLMKNILLRVPPKSKTVMFRSRFYVLLSLVCKSYALLYNLTCDNVCFRLCRSAEVFPVSVGACHFSERLV